MMAIVLKTTQKADNIYPQIGVLMETYPAEDGQTFI